MGCNASKTYVVEDAARARALSAQGERTVKVIETKQKMFDELLSEGNISEETTNMFQNAYAKLHTVQVNSGQKLDASHKEQLRSLFESLDQGTFEHVYSLFNWELGVDAKEFVLTMSLLAVPTKDVTTEAVLIFTIFDPDGSGSLDREEFSSLMRATIMSKLTHVEFLLKNEASAKVFEKHMASEYTEENQAFYNAIVEWKKGTPTIENVEPIITKYIRAGSELEVNIPQTQQKEIIKTFDEAKAKNMPIINTIFDMAHEEIYKLMDKDSYARFKKNPEEVRELTDALFTQCDTDNDGAISMEEYKQWVSKNPDSMNFIKELHSQSQEATKMVRQSVYFKRLSMTGSPMLSKSTVALLQEKYETMETPVEEEESQEEEEEEGGNVAVDKAVLSATTGT